MPSQLKGKFPRNILLLDSGGGVGTYKMRLQSRLLYRAHEVLTLRTVYGDLIQ